MHSAPRVPVAVQPIEYAVPVPGGNSRVWAAAVILFAGLALIVLGGCFMIGIMASLGGALNVAGQWSVAHYVFIGVLYLLAFLCFGAAAILILSALRSLYRILRGQ